MPRLRSSIAASLLMMLTVLSNASAQKAEAPKTKPAHVSRYLDSSPLLYEALIPQPPGPGSAEASADLAAVHRLQASRTPAEIESARRDDTTESIFAFDTVLGPKFAAVNLPLTAALSLHLREESAVVNPSLKLAFHRLRPFITDHTVSPVCERTATDSYPSGHAMVGYLDAFALAQMLPDKADAILRRADDYAHNRVVCGVHYPSDVAASHVIATALFATLLASPSFQRELDQAKREVRGMQ